MSGFTVLGVLFFWMICWQVGELAAKALHFRSLMAAVMEPIHDELEAGIAAMTTLYAKDQKP